MRASGIALLAAGVLLIAGCDLGGNEAAKSTHQVVVDTQHAIETASSYHVSGSFKYGSVDLWFANGKGAAGWIYPYPRPAGAKGTYWVFVIGNDLYLRGDFTGLGGPKGKWLKGSTTSGVLAKWWSRTSPSKIFEILYSHKLTNRGLTGWDDQDVVDLRSWTDGIAYVAAHGTPYPVAFVWEDDGTELNFEDWNGPVPLTAPKGAIDASRFGLG